MTDEDRNYVELATKHMMHTCNRGENGCLNDQGICEKHFPKPMTETTHFDDRGYPIYRRSTPESSKVVPHNRSEEHTSELQSLMRTSYAVFCLKKKTQTA